MITISVIGHNDSLEGHDFILLFQTTGGTEEALAIMFLLIEKAYCFGYTSVFFNQLRLDSKLRQTLKRLYKYGCPNKFHFLSVAIFFVTISHDNLR